MPKLPEGDTLILPELVQYIRLPPHIIDDLAQRQVLPGQHAGGRICSSSCSRLISIRISACCRESLRWHSSPE